jgi:hypothetical protein
MTASRAKRSSSLTRRMMIYLFVIVFVSLLLGVEFLREIDNKDLGQELMTNLTRWEKGEIGEARVMAPVVHARNKVILLIIIQSFVTGVVLTMFVKKITIPLKRMFEVTTRMAQGGKICRRLYTTAEKGSDSSSVRAPLASDNLTTLGVILCTIRN